MKRNAKFKIEYNGVTVVSKSKEDFENFDKDIVDDLFKHSYIDEDTTTVDFSKNERYIIIDGEKYELVGDRLYYCED